MATLQQGAKEKDNEEEVQQQQQTSFSVHPLTSSSPSSSSNLSLAYDELHHSSTTALTSPASPSINLATNNNNNLDEDIFYSAATIIATSSTETAPLLSTLDLLSPNSTSLSASSLQVPCISTIDFPSPPSSTTSFPSLFQLSLHVLLTNPPWDHLRSSTLPWQLSQYFFYLLPSCTLFTPAMLQQCDSSPFEHMNLSNMDATLGPSSMVLNELPAHLKTLDLSFSYLHPRLFHQVPRLTYLNLSGAYPMHPTLFLSLPHLLPCLIALDLDHCSWVQLSLIKQVPWQTIWTQLRWISFQACFFSHRSNDGQKVRWFLNRVRPTLHVHI